MQVTRPTRPLIGIRFFTQEDTETALSWQYGAVVADIVPLTVSVFAYRPVLLRLQAMSAVPLSAQIVKWAAPTSANSGTNSAVAAAAVVAAAAQQQRQQQSLSQCTIQRAAMPVCKLS